MPALSLETLTLAPHERTVLTELVAHLRARCGPDLVRVVLFGSKARGTSDEESDIDVLVVVRMPEVDWRWRHALIDSTYDLELEHGVVLSLIIKSDSSYALAKSYGDPFIENVEQEGIELWTETPSEKSFAYS